MFGRKIRHMLEVRNMTQNELAQASGLHKNLISSLVNDKTPSTTTDTILKLSKALRVPPAYFFAEHAFTPLESLDLPDEIKEFILSLDNMDYLILASEWAKKGVPPEDAKKLIDAYFEIMENKRR